MAVAQSEPMSLKGHWHVDFSRSIDPWVPHPKSVTLDVIADDGTTYQAVETIVKSDGTVRKHTARATYDGKPYPVTGSVAGLTVAMTRPSPGSIRAESNTSDGSHSVIVCTLSYNQKTLICDETDAAPNGTTATARSVYLRD
jgi:hypothetical protein